MTNCEFIGTFLNTGVLILKFVIFNEYSSFNDATHEWVLIEILTPTEEEKRKRKDREKEETAGGMRWLLNCVLCAPPLKTL